MKKEQLKEIPISSFNEEGWLKPPMSVHFNLAILAKGLLIFIMSLASIGKSEQLLEIFFPDKSKLYIAIAMSIPPLVALVLLTLGEVQDYLKTKKILFSICFVQIVIEILLLVYFIINAYRPFESIYLYMLIGYLLVLFLTATSFKTKLYLNQIYLKKGVIEKSDKEAE